VFTGAASLDVVSTLALVSAVVVAAAVWLVDAALFEVPHPDNVLRTMSIAIINNNSLFVFLDMNCFLLFESRNYRVMFSSCQ
jgi:hypothetical protein